ncbi:GNAT family N-acetyltransferase [Pseudoxanthomonas dokdonensis]|uniref:N-acetyltransferase domain-containing protein n=1 Tax=Pseudoxanthomonas dokdonensis TaxID=344882 RepID=A0A0R0CU08_9GAMM|nr:GNAT family protein [Pseudoxanthomonas dokdonensis]KRG69124.1 hypothetical protein ABB29_11970 [Pseudoxanthomonas dokdonensis]
MRVAEGPEFLQGVIDHPKVKPWISQDGQDGPLPLSAIFDDGIGIEFATGGFFFHRLGDGVYEVHTLFLPGTRDALACAKAAAHYLFCGTDCTRIVTKVPEDNIPAWRLTEKVGFRKDRIRPAAFIRRGVAHDIRHYSLNLDDWMHMQESPQWVRGQCALLGQKDKGVRAAYRWAVMHDDYSILEN